MFRTDPLSIISFPTVHTAIHTGLLKTRKLSTNLYDIYHCFVYSEKLLMDRRTVRNMQSFIPKINSINQCVQLVITTIYLFIYLFIYHDARSHEHKYLFFPIRHFRIHYSEVSLWKSGRSSGLEFQLNRFTEYAHMFSI